MLITEFVCYSDAATYRVFQHIIEDETIRRMKCRHVNCLHIASVHFHCELFMPVLIHSKILKADAVHVSLIAKLCAREAHVND